MISRSFSNLAKDCLPIDRTTKSLPLYLNFRQISLDKLRYYIQQKDFRDYFRHPNQTGVDDFVRVKQIEYDLEPGALSDYLVWIVFAVFFLKYLLFNLGEAAKTLFLLTYSNA